MLSNSLIADLCALIAVLVVVWVGFLTTQSMFSGASSGAFTALSPW